jgi:hypothetical protein
MKRTNNEKPRAKLSLSRQTLQHLSATDLGVVMGGHSHKRCLTNGNAGCDPSLLSCGSCTASCACTMAP